MEEWLYTFLAQAFALGAKSALKKGLERKIESDDWIKAREELKKQMERYRRGELTLHPDLKEIYESYRNDDKV